MAQSLCKIYLHIVFHIKTTSPKIQDEHLPRLYNYIGKLVNTTGCHVVCIGGTENHVHALVLFTSTITVAQLVEQMKRNSSRWIKTLSPRYEKFEWQGGYAAFSVSQSMMEKTVNYIHNQEEHHKKQSFQDEYIAFLKLYGINFDDRYVLSD